MATNSPIVGIDLGTTNSAVAIFEKGSVRVLPNALGEPLTPSVVALDQRTGALNVGRTAKDIYLEHPDLGAALFKRGMGSDLRYTIAGAGYGAVELSALGFWGCGVMPLAARASPARAVSSSAHMPSAVRGPQKSARMARARFARRHERRTLDPGCR